MKVKREDGYTLVELMVGSVIFIVVLSAVLALFETAASRAPEDNEAGHAVSDARTGLTGMMREMREANTVSITPTSATLAMPAGLTVTYNCGLTDPAFPDYRYCRRTDSGGGASDVIHRVANGPAAVFTEEGAAYYRVLVKVPSRGERSELPDRATNPRGHDVVLEDGVYVRNMDTGI